MRLIKSVTLDVGSNAEVLNPILTSTAAEKYHILGVLSEKVENLRLRVYHEREMLWDVDSLLLPAYTDFVPLDLELPVGDVLYIGFKNETGGAVTGEDVGVVYEIMK
jgi:hypothetical protein